MTDTTTRIALTRIQAGHNDRTIFNDRGLDELAASLATVGLLQPVVVRPLPSGDYEIVAGERRVRAARRLGWIDAPCRVVDLDDAAASLAMLSENMARRDLDPVDEARAYQARMDRFGWTADEMAAKAGTNANTVRNRLALLALRDELLALVRTGDLTVGYAKLIADAGLDRNRQMMAFGYLRDNPAPTPAWLRSVCARLYDDQARESLFDLPLYGGDPLPTTLFEMPAATQSDPPIPGVDTPPTLTGTPHLVIDYHVRFWNDAALRWDARGKNFKRDACLAAAAALRCALVALAT